MKTFTLLALAFIDFLAGFLFGSLGHFFSLLCFLILALIRAIITIVVYNSESDKKEIVKTAAKSGILGAMAFYFGIILGVINLLFILVPYVPAFRDSSLGYIYQEPTAIIGGIAGGVICGFIYVTIYFLITLGTTFLYKTFKGE